MIEKLLYFFNKSQRKSLFLILIFMFVVTFLEMGSLGFIFSIVGTVSSQDMKSNLMVENLGEFFNLDSNQNLIYLLLIFLLFYLFKIGFLIFYNWFEANFIYSYKENLSSKVFKKYLNQNYSFFYNRNSSEFIRNLISEVDQFTVHFKSFLQLALEIIVVIGIFIVLQKHYHN